MTTKNKPIWVLHICNYLGVGGVQAFLMNYYRNIDKSKIQFAFAVQRDCNLEFDEEIIRMGGRIHKMPPMEKSLKSYNNSLKEIIKLHPEYKIVHAHMNHRNAVALSICKRLKLPIRISHSHSSGMNMNLFTRIRVGVFKYILRYVSTDFLACSKESAEYLYSDKIQYEILNNAIISKMFTFSLEKRERVRKSLNITSEYVIGHVGNFSEQKNYKFLIDIFSQLNKNSKLILVGIGELMQEIKDYAKKMEVSNRVFFLGERYDVPELMQAFDAFVFPSLIEGLGIVAIESQAAGLPTYCSSGVPMDVAITDLAVHIPISAAVEEWVRIINSGKYIKRRSTHEEICKSNYDIGNNAKLLEDYYLNKKYI